MASIWGLHQRPGQGFSAGPFPTVFLTDSPAISAAQNTHAQAVVFKVTKAVCPALDQRHFAVKALGNAVIRVKRNIGPLLPANYAASCPRSTVAQRRMPPFFALRRAAFSYRARTFEFFQRQDTLSRRTTCEI